MGSTHLFATNRELKRVSTIEVIVILIRTKYIVTACRVSVLVVFRTLALDKANSTAACKFLTISCFTAPIFDMSMLLGMLVTAAKKVARTSAWVEKVGS